MRKILRASIALLLGALTTGCSITSVQCGTDQDSTFVNYNSNFPTQAQTRHLADLCGFVYSEE